MNRMHCSILLALGLILGITPSAGGGQSAPASHSLINCFPGGVNPNRIRSFYNELIGADSTNDLIGIVPGATGFVITDVVAHSPNASAANDMHLEEDAGGGNVRRLGFEVPATGSYQEHFAMGIPIQAGSVLRLVRSAGSDAVRVTVNGYTY